MKNTTYNTGRSRSVTQGRASSHGFTLIELMIVVVIVGVIMLVAAPSYSTLIQRTRLKSFANEVVSSVYLARSEAIKRNATMTLCTSSDQETCTGGGQWEQGWVVLDPNDTVITSQQSLSTGLVLYNKDDAAFDTMTFQPSGLVTPAVMKLCQQTPTVGIEEKWIAISATGRTRVQTKTDGCP